MGPDANKLMRAIKARYPDIKAGAVIDPYITALDAGLNADVSGYEAALDELEAERVLRRAVEVEEWAHRGVGLNPQYEVTPEGEQIIAEA